MVNHVTKENQWLVNLLYLYCKYGQYNFLTKLQIWFLLYLEFNIIDPITFQVK